MHCTLCGSQGRPKYRLNGFTVLACPDCGLVFTDMQPTPDNLRQLYSLPYFLERREYYFGNIIADPATRKEEGPIRDFRRWLDLLGNLKGKGRLLDVGCGIGIFLKMARDQGWQACGIDISKDAVEVARDRFQVEALAGTLQEHHFPERSFDVVTLLDVFEHLPDPLGVLEEIERILKNDGVIFLNTPNERGLLRVIAHALYRLSLGMFTYPVRKVYHQYHLYYYSPQTLEATLRRGGFRVVHCETKPIPLAKARGTPLEKAIVRGLSWTERVLHMEYELIVAARKLVR